jgi:magnesium transporter
VIFKGGRFLYYQVCGRLCQRDSISKEETGIFCVTLSPEEWDFKKTSFGFPSYTGLEHAVIRSCKAEVFAGYIFGSLYIPDKLCLSNPQLSLIYYINERWIVFVDDSGLTDKMIGQLIAKYKTRDMTPELFICIFFSEFLSDDIALLEQFENRLFQLEETALSGNIYELLPKLLHVRRELMLLRNYYEEMEDMTRELENSVSQYFHLETPNLIHLLGDRCARLQSMTQHSIEYCQTLRDFEQAQSDHKQNKTMRLLTIITSIFFPLTLVAGWYGMNFRYMPELNAKYGYPAVFLISLVIILTELIILKRKGMI